MKTFKITIHVSNRWECPFRQPSEHASESLYNHDGLCDHPSGRVSCSDKTEPIKDFPINCPLKDGDICEEISK